MRYLCTAVIAVLASRALAETDLQVVSVGRVPRFERYAPEYTGHNITEPSGFGPYWFTAATSLGAGQTAGTPRWPTPGQVVTYIATIRNRGDAPWSAPLTGAWRVDGQLVQTDP